MACHTLPTQTKMIQCRERRHEQMAVLAASFMPRAWLDKRSGLTSQSTQRDGRAIKTARELAVGHQTARKLVIVQVNLYYCRASNSVLLMSAYSCRPSVGRHNTTYRDRPRMLRHATDIARCEMIARVHVPAGGASHAPLTPRQWTVGRCLSSHAAFLNELWVGHP